MPRRIKTRRPTRKGVRRVKTAVVRRRQRGKGFWSGLKRFGSKANRFLKRTKAISRAAKFADQLGLHPYAGKVGQVASQLGYGRRKRRVVRRRRRTTKGKGIGLPGGGVRLAGRRRTGGSYSKKKVGIHY
jgi:hypothetical protein